MVCCYISHPYIALPTLTATPAPPTQVALAELDEVTTTEDWQRYSFQSTEGSPIDSEVPFSLAETTSEILFTQQHRVAPRLNTKNHSVGPQPSMLGEQQTEIQIPLHQEGMRESQPKLPNI